MTDTSAQDTQQEWERWWGSLPGDVRKKITDYEASIGTRVTWNQRYMLAPRSDA